MAKKDKLRIGHIGWLSADESKDWTTVAWCDINAEGLKAQGQRHPHIKLYTDYREMLKHPGLDAVVISTPNFVHADQAVAFLGAGKHVMLEKPMGVNREECSRIIKAWKKSKRNLTIDFEMRASPFAQRIKKLIGGGEYGELKRMEFIHHRGCWLEQGNGIWRTRPEKSGGMYFMEPIHEVDIFRFFAGEIESVISVAGPNVLPQYRFEDNVCSHFFFAGGVLGTVLTTHTHSAIPTKPGKWSDAPEYMDSMGHDMQMILTLTKASIGIDFIKCRLMINRIEPWPEGTQGARVVCEHHENFTHASDDFFHDISVMRHEFLRRCARGEPPLQDPMDIWKTHIACLAAEQSWKEDCKRVKVNYSMP